jgi:hypothetical protein
VQKFESVHAGELEIGHHKIDSFLPQELQALLGVGRGEHAMAFLAQIEFEQAAQLGFVFDD